MARFLAPLRRAERDGQPVIPTHRRRQQSTPTASHVAGLFLRRQEAQKTLEQSRQLQLHINRQYTEITGGYERQRREMARSMGVIV